MSVRVLGAILALGLLALADLAAAQEDGWAIQTVALRDFREAQNVADGLRGHGFPAFTEFTMSAGLQYVRVRVGCWTSRDAAVTLAQLLRRGGFAAEAEVVPHSEGSPYECVRVEVGFLTPSTWTALHGPGEVPTFRVELAGHVGHIRHDGERWSVAQGAEAPAAMLLPPTVWRYGASTLADTAVVLDPRERPAALVCPGQLIGQVGDVAIVGWSDAVVACRPPSGAPLGVP